MSTDVTVAVCCTQIAAISEATGSDDTKGASRWLLRFMKLIIKGLYRALIMGAVYGTLVALHGNDLKQLTPLTQVIMGAFQVCETEPLTAVLSLLC
jgi:hypothetical protein